MTVKQRLQGPTLQRAVDAAASDLNAETRQFTLSFSSEIPYLRQSWFDEPWLEVLGNDPEEVDMTRLDSGNAPLLWGHDGYGRENNIGVVEKAWVEGGRGYANVRLSMREDVASIWQDVQDGILRNVSVGYQIQERTLTKQNETGPSEYRVTRWLPLEISLVSVPADETVGVGRSAEAPANYVVRDLNSESQMPDKIEQPADPANHQQRQADPVVAPTAAQVSEAATRHANEAVTAERARAAGVADLCRKHGMAEDFTRDAVSAGKPLDAVRSDILEALAKRDAANPHNGRVSIGKEENEKQREAAESWLLYRGAESVDGKKIDINGNPFRGASLVDLARASLERVGERPSMDKADIAVRAITHSTSDFPILLQNVMHKTLLNAYAAIPDTWRTFCAVGDLADFRPHYRYRMGSFGNLATVGENGEFTYGTFSDAERETITGATKGKLLNISRQMIINDDLGGFLGASRAMGRGAARTIEVDVYALLAANPTMGDGIALFHASHNNIAAVAAAPTVASFDAGRVAMASQFDVGANDYTDIRPSVWLGPVSLGGAVRVVNESQYDVDVSNKFQIPNKSRGLIASVVDTPRLSSTPWYFFADPGQEPVFEVGFLNGQQTPYTEMKLGFEVDGVTWKIRHDYGVAAVGWRGAYKNAGA